MKEVYRASKDATAPRCLLRCDRPNDVTIARLRQAVQVLRAGNEALREENRLLRIELERSTAPIAN